MKIRLSDLEMGAIFEYNGTYALKSEYRTNEGVCECYIVGSGEMFWGGVSNPNELMVRPVNLKEISITDLRKELRIKTSHKHGLLDLYKRSR